ncbi:methyltransferase family protein [Pontibacter ummariensis]|uniref:Methyltransferase domain-containing protein n=1 Tax=Pontibacter ummariensis TaxID=1610492 RepID=A0A239K827_9BACT|nr:class I SAM-dependent methyltransferase [Pontibacter ummariensis]PRY06751.1 methyltransferase family protein [Pontibacter ummariensis]SNT13314.1 Methyltransferase domain-containing protein [Pontibacter ummariensis]
MKSKVLPYLIPDAEIQDMGWYLECPIPQPSEGLKANAYYFSHPEWAEEYLTYCHRSEAFKSRWQAAVGDWNDKIVVDIGCGPGNIFATLQGKPKLLIGIDVAPGSLELAKKQGYDVPILADATKLPFVSNFADIVTLNAALHHCDDMEAILKEAARLVKPGGIIVTDHDPQISAWDYKGLAKLLWNGRLLIYKITGHGFHKTDSQQSWGLACEIHHKPGHGVSKEFFMNNLKPLGFEVNVFPHNHELGAEVLRGEKGKAEFKYRLGNILSGRNPNAAHSALTLMCVAKKSSVAA